MAKSNSNKKVVGEKKRKHEPIEKTDMNKLDDKFPKLPEGSSKADKTKTDNLIAALSLAIKEANSKVSTYQKKKIYQTVSSVMSEGSYKQIITGFYLAVKNYELGKAILAKLLACIQEKDEVIGELYAPKKDSDKAAGEVVELADTNA